MQQPQYTPSPPVRLLRRAEVKTRTGLSVSQLYRLMSRGQFPQPVKLSERSIAWPEHEIQGWIEERLKARDAGPASPPPNPGREQLMRVRQRLINPPA